MLGGYDAYGPLAVGTLDVGVVVGVVLRYGITRTAGIQSSLNGVLTIRLVLPCNDRWQGRSCLVVTVEDDGLEEDDNVLLVGTLDSDSQGGLYIIKYTKSV